jgi:hypothetical protein
MKRQFDSHNFLTRTRSSPPHPRLRTWLLRRTQKAVINSNLQESSERKWNARLSVISSCVCWFELVISEMRLKTTKEWVNVDFWWLLLPHYRVHNDFISSNRSERHANKTYCCNHWRTACRLWLRSSCRVRLLLCCIRREVFEPFKKEISDTEPNPNKPCSTTS